MFGQTFILLGAAGALSLAGQDAAQDPPTQLPPASASAPTPAPPVGLPFPSGAEVLSVDGEALGVLAGVETRPGGERILHIRRTDGSMTAAPASVASRGERAVVLDWTRAEFEATAATAASDSASASPVPPTM
ncbi:hypothetical protein [Brevundimonas sp.]|uniref:hypothetical protein n=1 Tax=Brevundimonas sp. TaxID=1871086 RepID=UPI002D3A697C|nr:hypothetical protein [Brevundimonas sp.]HYD26508.1 hypothetical protein [Brevundimonas sp.]